jgi:hypothetical protein
MDAEGLVILVLLVIGALLIAFGMLAMFNGNGLGVGMFVLGLGFIIGGGFIAAVLGRNR